MSAFPTKQFCSNKRFRAPDPPASAVSARCLRPSSSLLLSDVLTLPIAAQFSEPASVLSPLDSQTSTLTPQRSRSSFASSFPNHPKPTVVAQCSRPSSDLLSFDLSASKASAQFSQSLSPTLLSDSPTSEMTEQSPQPVPASLPDLPVSKVAERCSQPPPAPPLPDLSKIFKVENKIPSPTATTSTVPVQKKPISDTDQKKAAWNDIMQEIRERTARMNKSQSVPNVE